MKNNKDNKKAIINRLIEINKESFALFIDNVNVFNKLTIEELRKIEVSSMAALAAASTYIEQIKER